MGVGQGVGCIEYLVFFMNLSGARHVQTIPIFYNHEIYKWVIGSDKSLRITLVKRKNRDYTRKNEGIKEMVDDGICVMCTES